MTQMRHFFWLIDYMMIWLFGVQCRGFDTFLLASEHSATYAYVKAKGVL